MRVCCADTQVCGSLKEVFDLEFNRKAITTVELRTAKGEMEKLTSILNENEMEGLLRAIQEVTIEAGQTIITKGEKGTHMYIIKSGTYTTRSSSSTAHCTAALCDDRNVDTGICRLWHWRDIL